MVVKAQAPSNVRWSHDVPHVPYDLILIDGNPPEHRAKWLTAAPQLVKPGGWVVLDNANRPEYAAERKHMQEIAESFETFDCNEMIDERGKDVEGNRTRYLVTEFYKMKGATDEDRTQPKPQGTGRPNKARSSRRRNTSAKP